ncbi:helicase-exonuclease AddAB subunit AddA [Jeotgalibaca sp. A122]|uniref:helicase-exonuclease AddAB subunit AddA n=1 Tax=Jeotgalibaca sp. A122 TaxID=3457322 RepID=UPI003FD18BBF
MAMIPPKTANDRFTDEQWQAIYQTGDNLLVAASAGSGKTTVLVQRIIEKIKNGVNVDELLVVTFTESAAVEMKERIRIAIQKAINQAVDDDQYRHLLRQTTLLPQANISTIHAFCLKVIQRFFYLIDVDPVFRIMADTIEVEMLKEDVWEELKEELYADFSTDFRHLSKAYSSERNDEGLKDLIFSLYNFSRANPEPALWLDHMGQLYDVENGLEQSQLFQTLLKPQIEQELLGIIYDCNQAIHLGGEADETAVQRQLLENEKNAIEAVFEAIRQDDYQSAYENISNLSFKTWRSATKKNETYRETINFMKNLRDKYKKSIQKLQENFFIRSRENHEKLIFETKHFVDEMARVTKLFNRAYWEKKLSGNTLDFNDLEHLTLEILMPLKEGKRQPSEASLYYRNKFSEVLIDEYQDVNKLQESILYGVTRHHPETENLFMVGDVKQSIYAFRLADPSLFLKKYEDFATSKKGERIILAENFRSRDDVISFTNFIFKQLMDKQVGQMDYDHLAELKQGNLSFPETDSCQTEVLIYLKGEGSVDTSNDNETTIQADPESIYEIDDKATGEITMVAQKIRDLMEAKTEIYDKEAKGNRVISYKDIVLLTPTKKNNLLILETFMEYGIPVVLNDSQSFFQRTEISTILSVLKVIDNPRQDIPLVAVLRSPIVGLNERQLASIRLTEPNGDFYEAVETYLGGSNEKQNFEERDTHRKLSRFMEQLRAWRTFTKQDNLVNLIWRIYEDTLFLDYVGGMAAGKQRVANLHALYERAQKFEATNFKGLFQFIRFIERIQDRDQDLAEPTTFSEDEDAVRIMTIHASKGLEFPIVFVLDMSKRFNKKDIQGKYVFSEKYGIGTDYFDVENRLQYVSLARIALANEKEKNMIAEEMRKLYVALTRAEQKLYLVGTYDTEEKMWQEWSAVDESRETVMPNHLRLQASNMMKWVGLALYRHGSVNPDAFSKQYRGELSVEPVKFKVSTQSEGDILGNILTVNLEEEKDVDGTIKDLAEVPTGKEILKEYKLAKNLMEATYPNQAATYTTSYQSVSEIKRLFEDPDQSQLLQVDFERQNNPGRYVEPDFPRPSFLQQVRQPTNAEIGTAVHYVMQHVDLDTPISDASISLLIQQLMTAEAIDENVARRIDGTIISGFFQTELGQRILFDHEKVHREIPFTMLMKAGNLFEGIDKNGDDNLLIHGIMDGFIEYEDHIILFDFKTDYVGDNLDQLVNKYRGQMIVYREALEEIKKKKVTETYLCLLNIQQNILVD